MGKNVLIVDDAAFMRMMIKDILTKNGYTIAAEAENGKIAVDKYNEVKPDLVTMDIIMTGMDGLDASEVILKQHPDARIVMISSLAYDDTYDRARAIGVRGFVDKPFHQGQLLKVFEEALS